MTLISTWDPAGARMLIVCTGASCDAETSNTFSDELLPASVRLLEPAPLKLALAVAASAARFVDSWSR